MRNFLKTAYKSFPIQLLIVNIRQNHLSMLLWFILFGFISQNIALRFGVPYLFLDPEYMGHIGFSSFFILGFCLGGFLMTINLSTYINYGNMFPFLGGIRHPFTRFSYNNSILFILFICYYTWSIIVFQLKNEFQTTEQIVYHLLGLYSGMLLFSGIASMYFRFTNTDAFQLFGLNLQDISTKVVKKVVLGSDMQWKRVRTRSASWDTSVYFHSPISIRNTSEIPPFDTEMLNKVIKRNQVNAIIIQIITLSALSTIGFFGSIPYFQIPAGASLLILFSAVVMISGAISYWLRGWQWLFWVMLILFFSYLNRFQSFDVRSAAYGINYNKTVPYNNEHLAAITTDSLYHADSLAMITVLNNWKTRVQEPGKKPKLVILSTSGGGQRATLFTLGCLQLGDSLTNGKLFNNTSFIGGASGGLLGATYYRELYLRRKLRQQTLSNREALEAISQDALNPIALNLAVTDIFIPFQKVIEGNNVYHKDRAYALEKALSRNTQGVLDKRIAAYREAERSAQIPTIVYTPSIINDGRKLLISPQKVSFLSRPPVLYKEEPLIDGIEFSRFFSENDPDSLLLTSAIRMSASFPYISPTTCLPSSPLMQVIDAGLRDNLGGELTLRYFQVFKKWISANTSGVIFVQIRDTPYDVPLDKPVSTSVISRMFDPIAGFYGNWERFQQYNQENLGRTLQEDNALPIHRLVFQYVNDDPKQEKASISWHLTSLEKKHVLSSIHHPKNQASFKKLESLLAE